MEVDLFMAWDFSNANFLRKIMAAYRLLMERNLEHLAFPAVGHVVRSGTNDICGLMTAAGHGRMVEHSDKTAVGCNIFVFMFICLCLNLCCDSQVYKAIAQIERAGLLYTGIKLSNIMLSHEGQVRLLSLCSVMCQPADPAERARELAYWHWEQLETLFADLKAAPNPFPIPREMRSPTLSLPPFPLPERGPVLKFHLIVIEHDYLPGDPCGDGDGTEEAEAVDEDGGRDAPKEVARSSPRPRSLEVLVFDAPVNPRSLRVPRANLLARGGINPYPKPDKLLQELLRVQSWHRKQLKS